ncbi:hypothetical protein DKP76_16450 [Falsochrobactrum shanghaiense]|uniref:PepSY domain-containing protein n=1 Tax=Falsochrobactrum shanghaiense TaxID=2201899 RepID=A0A316J5A6_9HYPH|nr:hypothetical protein [Falsochrobactrum shanghaiense]PWL16566.1 hypothetical protein DKP76_16450 [Falsochrobactrum shanghaiense]
MKRTIRYFASAAFMLLAPAALAQTAPSDDAQTPAISTPGKNNPQAPVAGENSFTEDQARERIMDAGFTDITNLQLGEDGIWSADAAQNGQTVKVLLDFQGNVTTK